MSNSPAYGRLLAKGTRTPASPEAGRSLFDHTMRTMRAAQALLDATAAQILKTLGLEPEQWTTPLHRATLLAAFLHDLGKANTHFQAMVRGEWLKADQRQAHRHELFSVWLAGQNGPLGEWLFGAGADETRDVIRHAVLCAVAGHHLQLPEDKRHEARAFAVQAPSSLEFLGGHPDFTVILDAGAEALELGQPPPIGSLFLERNNDWLAEDSIATLKQIDRALPSQADTTVRRFVGAVKALVLAADLVASGSVRQPELDSGENSAESLLVQWLQIVCTGDDLEHVAVNRLAEHARRAFQEETAASTARVTLVRAGCGTGKTVAAFLWGARRARGRKLFVCYPTTGTATEGFRDYVADEDALQAILYHSRASVDLELMDNGTAQGSDAGRAALEEWASYRALSLWQEQVVICTADTVLGLLQNYRAGLAAFPALAESSFVFDEIHLYDNRMFSALCRFLVELPGAPVLLMTASLQADRLRAIERALTASDETLHIIAGPAELEDGPRYTLTASTPGEAMEKATATLEAGSKVLWVCNTVDEAITTARSFENMGIKPFVYHSRFRYLDRAKRHRELVDAFDKPGPVLAVTTQVCEVSLDLSADLLVSEIATVPAMIQRLGRLNRRFNPKCPRQKPALFLEPKGSLPYKSWELEIGRTWLASLENRPCSQRHLAEEFERLEIHRIDDDLNEHVWLDRQPYAVPAPLRDIEASISILLPEDVGACRGPKGRPVVNEIIARCVPMTLGPAKDEFPQWKRLGMAFVVPPGRVLYCERTGAQWTSTGKAAPSAKSKGGG